MCKLAIKRPNYQQAFYRTINTLTFASNESKQINLSDMIYID